MTSLLQRGTFLVAFFLFILVGVFGLGVVQANAEDCVWDATTNHLVSEATNWTGCTLSAGDALIFDSTTNTYATWDAGVSSVASVTTTADYTATISITAPIVSSTGSFTLLGAGIVSSSAYLDIGGAFHVGSGATFTGNVETVGMTGTANFGGAGSITLYNFLVGGAVTLTGNVTTTNQLTINSTKSLDASTYRIDLTKATGSPFVVNGTFTASTSTINFAGTSANVPTSTYYNLSISTAGTLVGNVTSTNVLTIPASRSLNASTMAIVFTRSGTPLVSDGTFTAGSSTVRYLAGGSVVAAGQTYWNLYLGAGTNTLGATTTSTNSFVNAGTFTVGSGQLLYAPGTFNNDGTITETGAINHPLTSALFTNSTAVQVGSYSSNGGSVYITVRDDDGNLNASALNTITGTVVTATGFGDSETITLTETGNDTGIFISSALPFVLASAKSNNDGNFQINGNGSLSLAFTDSKDGSDTSASSIEFWGSTPGTSGSGTGSPTPTAPVTAAPTTAQKTLTPNIPVVVLVGNASHTVSVNTPNEQGEVVITIKSDPVTVTLKQGEEQLVDTNKDGKSDLFVRVDKIQNNSVSLTILAVSDLEFSINQGMSTTTNRTVALYFNSANVSQVALSEKNDFTTPQYKSYATTMTFDLSEGNGLKTVYAKFKTSQGITKVVSDTINLAVSSDTTTPTPTPTNNQTPSATSCALQSGKPYKHSGASGVYYITENCTKRVFTSPQTYFTYFSTWGDVVITEKAALDGLTDDALGVMTSKTPSAESSVPQVVTSHYQFLKNFGAGVTNNDVKELQKVLKELGYFTYPTITGKFAAITREAVKSFQKAKGITPVTGYVGPKTRAVLNSL